VYGTRGASEASPGARRISNAISVRITERDVGLSLLLVWTAYGTRFRLYYVSNKALNNDFVCWFLNDGPVEWPCFIFAYFVLGRSTHSSRDVGLFSIQSARTNINDLRFVSRKRIQTDVQNIVVFEWRVKKHHWIYLLRKMRHGVRAVHSIHTS